MGHLYDPVQGSGTIMEKGWKNLEARRQEGWLSNSILWTWHGCCTIELKEELANLPKTGPSNLPPWRGEGAVRHSQLMVAVDRDSHISPWHSHWLSCSCSRKQSSGLPMLIIKPSGSRKCHMKSRRRTCKKKGGGGRETRWLWGGVCVNMFKVYDYIWKCETINISRY